VVCPGFVPAAVAEHATGLRHFMMKYVLPHTPGARTLDQASENTVFAATNAAYSTKSGVFIGEEKEVPSSADAHDLARAKRFWEFAAGATGITI
jgi:hypothetical protein